MTKDELMELSAEKALRELSWESIEWLFQPRTFFELMLRLDFNGAVKMFWEGVTDESPDNIPHRFRSPYVKEGRLAIECEEFYRKIKGKHKELQDA